MRELLYAQHNHNGMHIASLGLSQWHLLCSGSGLQAHTVYADSIRSPSTDFEQLGCWHVGVSRMHIYTYACIYCCRSHVSC
jgi:hypothetical protein